MRAKEKQRGQEFNSFKKLVKKTLNYKAKPMLKPRFCVCETD